MTLTSEHIKRLIREGAARLIARADDARQLDTSVVVVRLERGVGKYVLRDDPNAHDDSINAFLDSLHADDLCLILACEQGEQSAWDDLVNRFASTVRSAARNASGSEDAADDLAQSIWAELYGLRKRADGTVAGKLSYYSGKGSLGGWLRAVVGQLAVDKYRKNARLVQTEQDEDLDRLANDARTATAAANYSVSHSANPETDLLETRAATDVDAAVARAIGELSAEDRLLIRLYYFNNMRLREIGALLGFHEATASRKLTRLQTDLRRRIAAILTDELGWSDSDASGSLAQVYGCGETDLEALLSQSQTGARPLPERGG